MTHENNELLPPHDLEAERALLGSFLQTVDAGDAAMLMASVGESISTRNAFYLPDHQLMWDVMSKLVAESRPVDAVTFRGALQAQGLLEVVGGTRYVAEVMTSVPSKAHAAHYAGVVADAYRAREVIRVCSRLTSAAYRREATGAELVARLAVEAAAVTSTSAGDSGGVTLASALEQTLADLENGGPARVFTGIEGIDRHTGGIALGEMIVVAARPSMGKSLVARQLALNIAASGVPVGIFALEESRGKIARNAIANWGAIPNKHLRLPEGLSGPDWQRIADASARLAELPIYIDDRTSSVDQITARMAAWAARHGVKAVVIDHLGRVNAPGKSPYERASEASRKVADAIHRLGLAGIVACQLSRAVVGRDDKRPGLADLRDSGRIEEDADGVLLLHREDYYRIAEPGYVPDGLMEIHAAKWRDSARGWTEKVQVSLNHQRTQAAPVQTPFDTPRRSNEVEENTEV